jgi:hypothetical protein
MQQNTSSSDQLNTRVALYTAIAGTLFTGAALASPTMSPVTGLSVTVDEQSGSQYLPIDIDGDGNDDFSLSTWYSTGCTYSPGNSYLYRYNSNQMLSDDGSYGGMISGGTAIPGALSTEYSLNFAACNQSTEFAPNTSGYAGFQFDSGGNTHYGYMLVGTAEGSLVTTLYEVCYESIPGAAISAGACRASAPIPVGGLIPISLGVLATGAFALRRRRKHLN